MIFRTFLVFDLPIELMVCCYIMNSDPSIELHIDLAALYLITFNIYNYNSNGFPSHGSIVPRFHT